MTHKDIADLQVLLFGFWLTIGVTGVAIVYVLEQIRNELRKKK